MIGLLTEQYAGAFPFWLSPVQVAVLPIADRHVPHAVARARALQGFEYKSRALVEMRNSGEFEGSVPQCSGLSSELKLRVHVDDRRESLNKKIRESQLAKYPVMAILGDRDIENRTVGVRSREEGDLGAMTVEAFGEFLSRQG
jgi:threonyl-tRNA synthetase